MRATTTTCPGPRSRAPAATRPARLSLEVDRTQGAGQPLHSGDSPSWTLTRTGGPSPTSSRDNYLTGLDGSLLAIITTPNAGPATTTYALADLHGDITATTTPDAAGAPDGQALGTDEYGNASTVTRYGYLGAHQRETDTLTGVTLMGARLYVPSLGRFLSHDPVYGGNDTKYGYPVNPIAIIDVSGLAPTCGAVSSGCSKTPIYGYRL